MECPNCKKFIQANSGLFGTGLFARKNITCSCNYTFEVKTNKLATRTCVHCGNEVVFDQSKGDKAKCPVCHEPINEIADKSKVDEFSCAQCGIKLVASKSASTRECPVCGFVNDVQKQLTQEHIKKDGLASIIKYEGDNETFIWKHPIEDFNLGSQLIVHESQEAVFFKDGQALDLFGAGRYTLETQQLPILESVYHLPTDTSGTFHSEVYFINLATQMGIKWGTDSKVRLFDPASGMHIEIGACGEFNIHVTNSRKLLMKLVGTASGLKQEQLLGTNGSKGFFKSLVIKNIKTSIANSIKKNGYSLLEIDYFLDELSYDLKSKINMKIESYGLEITELSISNILYPTPQENPLFDEMRKQYGQENIIKKRKELNRLNQEAESETELVKSEIEAKKVINKAMAEAQAYKMQAEAEAMEMKMKGYTYQQETARQVGLEAMKNGLTGNGALGTGTLGDMAGLGIGFGAMGSVMNMTRDAFDSNFGTVNLTSQNVGNIMNNTDTWDCQCGQKGISGNFCNNCGSKKPSPQTDDIWDCSCGNKNIIGNFCNNCGTKRPEKPSTWDCSCGNKNIIGNFCNNCGAKRPEKPSTWDCSCGNKNITGNFCNNCGKRKGE